MSPALEGGFSTTVPPGKSHLCLFCLAFSSSSLYLESLLGWRVQDEFSGGWCWLLTVDPGSPLYGISIFIGLDPLPFLLVSGQAYQRARGKRGRPLEAQTLECTWHHFCHVLLGNQTIRPSVTHGARQQSPLHDGRTSKVLVATFNLPQGMTKMPKAESHSYRSEVFYGAHILRL